VLDTLKSGQLTEQAENTMKDLVKELSAKYK
jgi:hypothetical protein